jgi:lipopolysaccharide/colanic/teichoic acid biosynthesis glycosyltransferase
MHPYAEYLQEYVYDKSDLQEGGKFKDDFRITTIGKIFRKFWIDELPMLINFFRREMKLVGVRPLSEHYFSLYSKELQEKRIKTKPGLIPPFYVDMPKTIEEIQASELKYIEAYEKHPCITDWKYFWKAVWNILFRKARSS